MIKKHTVQHGFTLVELAIVMTIIGLLIGGILKGQELIEQARLKATIKHVQSYDAAVTAFLDKYSQWPGDMANATNRIPGCTAPCMNGNGNSKIGSVVTAANHDFQQGGIAALPEVETTMAWQHLALAGLISGIKTGADPVNEMSWGNTHPSAPLGGGFTISYNANAAFEPNVSTGHFLMHKPAVNSRIPNATNAIDQAVSRPQAASQLDRKMDDGDPQNGYVGSESFISGCNILVGAERMYNETLSRIACVQFFVIGPGGV